MNYTIGKNLKDQLQEEEGQSSDNFLQPFIKSECGDFNEEKLSQTIIESHVDTDEQFENKSYQVISKDVSIFDKNAICIL